MDPIHSGFLTKTIDLAKESIKQGGGPFAAIVVDRKGMIIGQGTNSVTNANDPTAHAEVVAIRNACKQKEHFQLDGCTLYTSCEPCPMCLGAIYWARPEAVYFAATKKDAAAVGFDDAFIYEEIKKDYDVRQIPFYGLKTVNRLDPFQTWATYTQKIEY
ncbi:nucleoside deaminase [Shouchella patagoniensis]|uniref:nucleoside deaminase n=1 Tax=Shouchella patagoniensis TaxID=228576 RepID=UPI000994B3A1|nr:nucleoside deaminase [Shouchella patagoniensis]